MAAITSYTSSGSKQYRFIIILEVDVLKSSPSWCLTLWHQFLCYNNVCKPFCLSVEFILISLRDKTCILQSPVAYSLVKGGALCYWRQSILMCKFFFSVFPLLEQGVGGQAHRYSAPELYFCCHQSSFSLGSWKQQREQESAHWFGSSTTQTRNLGQVISYLRLLISLCIKSQPWAALFSKTHPGSDILWEFANVI